MSVLETIRAQLDIARRVVDVLERTVQEIEAAQEGDAPVSAEPPPRKARRSAKARPVAVDAPPSRRTAKPKTADGEKFCRACEQTKEVSEFNRNKSARDGLQSQCRVCQRKTIARSHAKAVAADEPEASAPAQPAGWVDPAARIKLIRERAARGAS